MFQCLFKQCCPTKQFLKEQIQKYCFDLSRQQNNLCCCIEGKETSSNISCFFLDSCAMFSVLASCCIEIMWKIYNVGLKATSNNCVISSFKTANVIQNQDNTSICDPRPLNNDKSLHRVSSVIECRNRHKESIRPTSQESFCEWSQKVNLEGGVAIKWDLCFQWFYININKWLLLIATIKISSSNM